MIGKQVPGWVLVLLLLAASVCHAQQTEYAIPLEPGEKHLELYHATGWSPGERDRYTELLLRVGKEGSAEYSIVLPSYDAFLSEGETTRTYGNIGFAYKWLLAAGDEKSALRRPVISLFANIVVPHADHFREIRRWDTEAAFAFNWTLPADLTMDANLGWARVPEKDEPSYHLLRGTLCLTRSWSDTFSTYVELGSDVPITGSAPDSEFAYAGFTVTASPSVDITIGGGVGLNGTPRPTLIDGRIVLRL